MSDQEPEKGKGIENFDAEQILGLFRFFGNPGDYEKLMFLLKIVIKRFGDDEEYQKMTEENGYAERIKESTDLECEAIYNKQLFVHYFFIFERFYPNFTKVFNYINKESNAD